MTCSTPKGKKIYILARDINGKKLEWEFENEDDFFNTVNNDNNFITDEDEILIVQYDGDVIYSSLNDVIHSLCIDNVIGFFG